MARRGRSLRFDDEEIEDLADASYGDRRTFSLLALLYPFVDLRNQFHVDHIFPKSAFRKRALVKGGLSEDEAETLIERANRIGNLQLLEGSANVSKQDQAPAEWLSATRPDEARRTEYRRLHDLPEVPDSLSGFDQFYEARRTLILQRLRALLGGQVGPAAPGDE